MPSLIDEQTQFTDTDGLPIVNGSVYFGLQNNDPVSNLITVYSDRDLTVPIANPQSTDSYGRTTTRVWVEGKYSLQVNDSSGVQKFQNLDAGDITQTGITTLSNVQGSNTITADASPAISSLVDQQQYNFTTALANTGAVTLQINLTAAKSIKKQHDVDLASGDFEAGQIVSVIYNETDDVFELVSNVSVAANAQVTNHIRAGNTQLLNGSTVGNVEITISTVVTESTFESVGPTGSGADNIWAAMDILPASATFVIVDVEASISADSTSLASVQVFATSGDVSSPVADYKDNRIAYLGGDHDAAITGISELSDFRVPIPLGAGQIFKVTWADGGSDSTGLNLIYRGFMTDA